MTVERKPQALKYKALSNTRPTSFYIFPVAQFSISSPITKILSHTQVLVSGWGAKPVFCLQLVFFKQKNVKNMAKINEIYQEVKIIFNYKCTLILSCIHRHSATFCHSFMAAFLGNIQVGSVF